MSTQATGLGMEDAAAETGGAVLDQGSHKRRRAELVCGETRMRASEIGTCSRYGGQG